MYEDANCYPLNLEEESPVRNDAQLLMNEFPELT